MAGGLVHLLLDDGEVVQLSTGEVRCVYNALWEIAQDPKIVGAVSTAALLLHELRRPDDRRERVELTPRQSAVVREALARMSD